VVSIETRLIEKGRRMEVTMMMIVMMMMVVVVVVMTMITMRFGTSLLKDHRRAD